MKSGLKMFSHFLVTTVSTDGESKFSDVVIIRFADGNEFHPLPMNETL